MAYFQGVIIYIIKGKQNYYFMWCFCLYKIVKMGYTM